MADPQSRLARARSRQEVCLPRGTHAAERRLCRAVGRGRAARVQDGVHRQEPRREGARRLVQRLPLHGRDAAAQEGSAALRGWGPGGVPDGAAGRQLGARHGGGDHVPRRVYAAGPGGAVSGGARRAGRAQPRRLVWQPPRVVPDGRGGGDPRRRPGVGASPPLGAAARHGARRRRPRERRGARAHARPRPRPRRLPPHVPRGRSARPQ
mmetsp:Transcript_2130/g.6562  ORF Transcript_2130/g.6562 Transcript_2130/m.6562 type:complete len:209 (+) Transcript_2130:82-708(+)